MQQIIFLFFTFFKIGLFSIGGGYAIIPMIQQQVVKSYEWISEQTFTDMIAISQMTPGPLAVNTSTFVGFQIAGLIGAIMATVGCILGGIVISLFLYRFFKKHRQSLLIKEGLHALKAASVGLILSAAVTILLTTFNKEHKMVLDMEQIDWIAVILFGISFFILRKWKINPVFVMLLSGGIGFWIFR